MAAGAGEVPRDLVVLELRGLPGAPARSEVPSLGRESGRALSYAERFGARRRPHADRRPRELSGGGRLRHHPPCAAAVHERPRADHGDRIEPRSGGVAERLKAPVLKTGIPQGIGGSNPSPSAMTSEGATTAPSETSPLD